jgi:uncharacterized protein YcgI (DUF1989 family)
VVSRPWTYVPAEPATIAVDRSLYERIATETDGRRLTHQHVVPIRSGYAWPVRAGQVCRVVAVEGPQVVDLTPGICRTHESDSGQLVPANSKAPTSPTSTGSGRSSPIYARC